MFGSSLPPVVGSRAHVQFTLFVCVCIQRYPTHIVLCFCCLVSSCVPYVASFSGMSVLWLVIRCINIWVIVSFIGGENRRSQVTDKLYQLMLYTSPWSRFELTTSVVIETDCINSWKSIRSRARRPHFYSKTKKKRKRKHTDWYVRAKMKEKHSIPINTHVAVYAYNNNIKVNNVNKNIDIQPSVHDVFLV